MSKSEEWEQFSAYRPMIEDAIRRGREQREAEIIETLKKASAYDRLKRNGQLTDTLDATIALIEGDVAEYDPSKVRYLTIDQLPKAVHPQPEGENNE